MRLKMKSTCGKLAMFVVNALLRFIPILKDEKTNKTNENQYPPTRNTAIQFAQYQYEF